MNKKEYLYVCLMEECAEVQKCISKLLRFGDDNHHPDDEETNLDRLNEELADLFAVINIINLNNGVLLSKKATPEQIEIKAEKITKYFEISEREGCLK